MPIYRLIPTAAANDPAWELSLNQGEVVVRADSTGEARAVAALEEAAARGAAFPLSTTQVIASAFRDDKLYTVLDEHSRTFAPDGPIGVLDADFHFPVDFVPLKAD